MTTNADLYAEENRTQLIDTHKAILELHNLIKEQTKQYKAPSDELSVKGDVRVNTETEIDVKNLEEVTKSIDALSEVLSLAIKNNSYKPVELVTVKNIKDAKPDALKITNFNELADYFNKLTKSIQDNQPIVNIAKEAIQFPTSASKPIAVRLSDGKSFYSAMTAAFTSGTTTLTDIRGGYEYNYIDVQQTSSTVETYVYKKDGSDGTIIRTITVVYTNSNKTDIDSVAWS